VALLLRIRDSSKNLRVRNHGAEFVKAGKNEPVLHLYDHNGDCIQAMLAGRADTYINVVTTVDQAVETFPEKLGKAVAVTLPYSIGITVPKTKPEWRDAILTAPIEVQTAGFETALLNK
jgi:polar amino acid transport system substrate-binding protein